MRQEWRQYWWESKKAAVRTLVVWPLVLTSLFFFINYVQHPEHAYAYFVYAASYSYLIPTTIYALYMVAWALITAYRSRVGYNWTQRMPFHLALNAVGLIIGVLLAELVGARLTGQAFRLRPHLVQSLASAGFVTLIFLFSYAYKNMRTRYDELEAASAEANFQTLKAQMQPHFLFNSLNSLTELINSDRDSAAQMTQRLADLYREILDSSEHKVAPLSREIALIRKYLELEQLRFGERLRFSLPEVPGAESVFLPSLMLQTLVENAVKHGISPAIEGGDIHLAVEREDGGWYRAKLVNTGVSYRPKRDGGTGLANTKARLALLYGDNHHFGIQALPQGGTEVSFRFPGDAG